MKKTCCTIFMILTFSSLFGQVRLDPADSSIHKDWFRENPWGIMITSSLLPHLYYNLNHNEMHEFLEDQGVLIDRNFDLLDYGGQVRWRKVLAEFRIAQGLSLDGDDESVSGTPVYLDKRFSTLSFSLGYMLFSNAYVSIVPRVGIGYSEYEIQYTSIGSNSPFDFNDPNAFSGSGSPRFLHQSGFLHIAVDVLNGFQGDRRNYVFQGVRLGYQRGWNDIDWDSNQATVINPLSDRSEQLYMSLVFGFARNLKKKS